MSLKEGILWIGMISSIFGAGYFSGHSNGVKEGLKMEPTEVLMDLCLHGTRIIHEGKWWEVACFPKSD